MNWELICVQEAAVDLVSIQAWIRLESRAELKEWSESLALHYLPRVPMGWSSSITGDRTKGTQDLPLDVTTAMGALDFNSSRMEDRVGVGTLEGDWVLDW